MASSFTIKLLAVAAASLALVAAPVPFADDMSKDSMSKSDAMKSDGMKKDTMSKDSMSKDSMGGCGSKVMGPGSPRTAHWPCR